MAGAVEVIVSKRKLAELQRMLRDVPGGLEKALVGAVNDTAQATKRQMATAIYERVMIKKKDISPHIRVTRARRRHPSATVSLSETHRLSLKRFGARQTKSGVSYRIERKGGRKRIPGAFGPGIAKLGGHVFRRADATSRRIIKLRGPSPWAVYVKAGIAAQTEAAAMELLNKKLDQRARFVLLKHTGAI
jgi:hypothetical protein